MSAKGVKRSAQRELVHQTFRDTLFTGKTMRVYNYNIVSKGHTNMTLKQNKLALSPFDSKRFLLFDEISTVPFGHKAAEENAFLEDIYMDTEWANSYNETDNSSPDFQLPDWGFLQRPYSETELQEEEEASSSRVRELPPINNPFILSEASEERPPKKQRNENQNNKH